MALRLVWLSGLNANLLTKGSTVQFPVRAHACVVGRVPSGGCMRGTHTLMFLSLSFSFPSTFSKINKILKIHMEKRTYMLIMNELFFLITFSYCFSSTVFCLFPPSLHTTPVLPFSFSPASFP